MRIRPFRALRPTPSSAAAVACVPYDVVSTEQARALTRGAPLSFLRVTRAEVDLGPDVAPRDPAVYAGARAALARLRREAPLVVEAEPALYVYRLRAGGREQTGLAGCFPLDDYDRGAVKRHERTRPDKEDDRTRHMTAVEAQTGIVFLAYRGRAEIDGLVGTVSAGAPLFDFEASDGVRHTVWRTAAGQTAALVDAFASVPALYIADGHHRVASAARARRELAAKTPGGEGAPAARDHFLAAAFPDRETRILPYNRTVSDLAGADPERFLAAVAARLPVEPTAATRPGKGAVAMYVGGRWHRVDLNPAVGGGAADPADGLDAARLQKLLLEPVLGVEDIRTDPRVRFVGGVHGPRELERLVDAGEAAVAFSLAAVTVEELLTVSDAGGIMPPKSTWFEPKLRDGLLTHLI